MNSWERYDKIEYIYIFNCKFELHISRKLLRTSAWDKKATDRNVEKNSLTIFVAIVTS